MATDIRLIKGSLVGNDLEGGGLVSSVKDLNEKFRQMTDTQAKVNTAAREERSERRSDASQARDINSKYVLALIAAFGTIVGIVVGRLLDIIK
jgi:F0F1-type ATP synthase assembly protein I